MRSGRNGRKFDKLGIRGGKFDKLGIIGKGGA